MHSAFKGLVTFTYKYEVAFHTTSQTHFSRYQIVGHYNLMPSKVSLSVGRFLYQILELSGLLPGYLPL